MIDTTTPKLDPAIAWTIHRSGGRTAHLRDSQVTLGVERRVARASRLRWAVYSTTSQVASGVVEASDRPWRYASFEREAMARAEAAARAYLSVEPPCDDCGRQDGTHDPEVEH